MFDSAKEVISRQNVAEEYRGLIITASMAPSFYVRYGSDIMSDIGDGHLIDLSGTS